MVQRDGAICSLCAEELNSCPHWAPVLLGWVCKACAPALPPCTGQPMPHGCEGVSRAALCPLERKGLDPAPAPCGSLVTAGTECPHSVAVEAARALRVGGARWVLSREGPVLAAVSWVWSAGPSAPPAPHQEGTTTLRHGRCRTCCWLGSSQRWGEGLSHSVCLQGMGRGWAKAATPSRVRLLAAPRSPSVVPHTVRGRDGAQWGCCRPPALGMESGTVPGGERGGERSTRGLRQPPLPACPFHRGQGPSGRGGLAGGRALPAPS